jgi:hypothetical protein
LHRQHGQLSFDRGELRVVPDLLGAQAGAVDDDGTVASTSAASENVFVTNCTLRARRSASSLARKMGGSISSV